MLKGSGDTENPILLIYYAIFDARAGPRIATTTLAFKEKAQKVAARHKTAAVAKQKAPKPKAEAASKPKAADTAQEKAAKKAAASDKTVVAKKPVTAKKAVAERSQRLT